MDTEKIKELFAIFNLIKQTLKKSSVNLPGNNGSRWRVDPPYNLTPKFLKGILKTALKNMYPSPPTPKFSHKFLRGTSPDLLDNIVDSWNDTKKSAEKLTDLFKDNELSAERPVFKFTNFINNFTTYITEKNKTLGDIYKGQQSESGCCCGERDVASYNALEDDNGISSWRPHGPYCRVKGVLALRSELHSSKADDDASGKTGDTGDTELGGKRDTVPGKIGGKRKSRKRTRRRRRRKKYSKKSNRKLKKKSRKRKRKKRTRRRRRRR
jgi:hypothetical protein